MRALLRQNTKASAVSAISAMQVKVEAESRRASGAKKPVAAIPRRASQLAPSPPAATRYSRTAPHQQSGERSKRERRSYWRRSYYRDTSDSAPTRQSGTVHIENSLGAYELNLCVVVIQQYAVLLHPVHGLTHLSVILCMHISASFATTTTIHTFMRQKYKPLGTLWQRHRRVGVTPNPAKIAGEF